MDSIIQEGPFPDWNLTDETCPICLELYSEERDRTLLDGCNHTFCKVCFGELLRATDYPDEEKSIRCPLCRRYCNITLKLTHRVFRHHHPKAPVIAAVEFFPYPNRRQWQGSGLSMAPAPNGRGVMGSSGNDGDRGIRLQDFVSIEIQQFDCGITETLLIREISVHIDPMPLPECVVSCPREDVITRRSNQLLKVLENIIPNDTTPATARRIERLPELEFNCQSRDKRADGSDTPCFGVRLSQSLETIRGTSREGCEVTLARWVTRMLEYVQPGTRSRWARTYVANTPMAHWTHLFRTHIEIQRVFSMSLLRDEHKFQYHELHRALASHGLDMTRSRLALDPRKEYYDVIYEYGLTAYCGAFLKERIKRHFSGGDDDWISNFEDTGHFARFENATPPPWPHMHFWKFNADEVEQLSPWCKRINEIIRTNF
jgi:hypothetical protein